jgi:BolA family transcriptional regulator, general stress-responsive regulator
VRNIVTNSDSIEAQIRARLSKLEATVLEIEDDSHAHSGHAGAKERGGGHFEIKIVSAQFVGKSLVTRHRLIYDALGDLMQCEIHALKIDASVPS